jgi:hypothetical protein
MKPLEERVTALAYTRKSRTENVIRELKATINKEDFLWQHRQKNVSVSTGTPTKSNVREDSTQHIRIQRTEHTVETNALGGDSALPEPQPRKPRGHARTTKT